MPPTDTNNSSLALPPIDTSNANPQKQSPLVGRISAEIRNHIFDLALTAYPNKQEPFKEGTYHCRPGFRYADVQIEKDGLQVDTLETSSKFQTSLLFLLAYNIHTLR